MHSYIDWLWIEYDILNIIHVLQVHIHTHHIHYDFKLEHHRLGAKFCGALNSWNKTAIFQASTLQFVTNIQLQNTPQHNQGRIKHTLR